MDDKLAATEVARNIDDVIPVGEPTKDIKEVKVGRPNMLGKWKTCESNFNLSRHLIPFMQNCPFYAEISRHIQKHLTKDIPTAAVTFDQRNDELTMYVNPDFLEPLPHWEIRGVINHEFDHLVFGHLNVRRREPAPKWNVATDLAINSLITQNMQQPRDVEPGTIVRALPQCALIPGQRPYVDPKAIGEMSPERKLALEKFSDIIEKFPLAKSSEWYFHKLIEEAKKNGLDDGEMELVLGPMDCHEGWDLLSDDMREYIEGKIKSIIEKAVRHADSLADGWGSIPMELREEIRRSVSNIVNWRNVLRQFVGMLVRGQRTTTIKRINKRYPYIHPGTKRGYTAKLLVAIDESGSVGDNMLEMFFAELEQLTRKVDVTLLHFDCSAVMSDLYEWKKGTRPQLKRVKGGGTNFDAPTNLVNDPKNRGRWDGALIMTDGCAPAPGPSRIKRGWILGQGCKLDFPSDEIQIHLSKDNPMSGAWR